MHLRLAWLAGDLEEEPGIEVTGPIQQADAALQHIVEDKPIAHTLAISANTVSFHVKNVMEKLGYHSRVDVAVWAKAHGFDI